MRGGGKEGRKKGDGPGVERDVADEETRGGVGAAVVEGPAASVPVARVVVALPTGRAAAPPVGAVAPAPVPAHRLLGFRQNRMRRFLFFFIFFVLGGKKRASEWRRHSNKTLKTNASPWPAYTNISPFI